MNEMTFHFPDTLPKKETLDSSQAVLFHQEYFQELADRHNAKWLNRINVALGRAEEKDALTIAREQAERERDERIRQESPEFAKWQESLKRVVAELQYVKDHPQEAKEAGIKPLLLIMGGGMRGPYCAGQVAGLHDAGYGSVFDTVVGFSAGSGPAAYFVAGADQTRHATSLFREECSTDSFLSLKRFPKKVIDTGVIATHMRSGPKALDQEAIHQSPTALYAGVTNTQTGKVEFINMKTATRDGNPDMVAACEASSAIPLFENPFEVNGKLYQDGSVGELPLEDLITQFSPTSILVLPNLAFSELDAMETNSIDHMLLWANKLIGHIGSLELHQTLGIRERSKKALTAIRKMVHATPEEVPAVREKTRQALTDIESKTNVKIGVLWPPHNGLSNLNNHGNTLKSAMMMAHLDVFRQFGQEQPEHVWF